ncbi:MAG: glycosyltransferase [Opitutaceae bacterium]|nr:glycosyltransferase [Opitutaceae bacterium]
MRLLIVSPHFPPTNAPDMQRARTALPWLLARGWSVAVLAVDPRDVAAPTDDALLASVPAGVRVERVRAWPLALTRHLGLRTLGLRAIGGLARGGDALIRDFQPDIVFFTTTQFVLTSLGRRWKRRHGVPFVVDLQDPWVTDYYAQPGAPRPPGGWKYRIAHTLAKHLEPRSFRPAAGFVSVSAAYLANLHARYAWFAQRPQAVIPFGADAKETVSGRTSQPAFTREPGRLHLVSVGAVGPIMQPAIRALLTAVRGLVDRDQSWASRLRLHFVGTSYAAAEQSRPSVQPLATELGLGDLVEESPARVPWAVAQATLRAADGLVIPTSDDPGYTPSKLAGTFLAERPVLLVARAGTPAALTSAELGLARLLDPTQRDDGALAAFLLEIADPREPWRTTRRADVFENVHSARARTGQLADFLEQAAASNRPSSA